MDENEHQHIIDQWAAGLPAPFDLYESTNIIDEQRVLVENSSKGEPIIKRGEPIPGEIASRVKWQHTATPIGDPVTVPIVVFNADGTIHTDDDGNAITHDETIQPKTTVTPFTYVEPVLAHEDDQHCDMCGQLRPELFKIGQGWYCKVERTPDGATEARTCFDWRVKQLADAGMVKYR